MITEPKVGDLCAYKAGGGTNIHKSLKSHDYTYLESPFLNGTLAEVVAVDPFKSDPQELELYLVLFDAYVYASIRRVDSLEPSES